MVHQKSTHSESTKRYGAASGCNVHFTYNVLVVVNETEGTTDLGIAKVLPLDDAEESEVKIRNKRMEVIVNREE